MLIASGAGSEAHISTLLIELGAIMFVLGFLGRAARLLRIPVIPLYLAAGLLFGQGGLVSLSASEDFLRIVW